MRTTSLLIVPFLFFLAACGSPQNADEGDDKGKGDKADSSKAEAGKEKKKVDGQPPESEEVRIRQATLPLPEDKRDSAMVLGRSGNSIDTLREGNNQFICLADDPEKEGFKADCYHKSLDAFMSMGRRLRREGHSSEEIFKERNRAIENGEIQMPDKKNLIAMSGKYDKDGKVVDRYRRYVIYVPFATAKSTGLPTQPMGEGEAWLMDPGTHKAHIMVSPVKGE